ncbi:hypothetical protein NDS46_30595 (plasmid) [Paenibacillus thiaminolyticus]|uniref:hypothetical protein n=1 Tax=Paenibacillus thiaminolyticus TaxID=49283 RepID=UPI00232C1FA3|nr:hypothetical protein [Paenibacillus thiaminolyticus]WCF11699.1 hypothetical protein NDS46_30595 [Paenibacillus thiaminolyticus]
MGKFDEQTLINLCEIDSLETLEKILIARHKDNIRQIERLAMSESPESDYERQRLIGENKLLINLITRIRK